MSTQKKPSRLAGMLVTSAIVALGAFQIATIGAMNGGNAPAASAFTPLKTWISTNFLQSDLVIVMALLAVIALVWGLIHGKGWGAASVVLGVITLSLLGPSMATAAATATRDPLPTAAASATNPSPAAASFATAVAQPVAHASATTR